MAGLKFTVKVADLPKMFQSVIARAYAACNHQFVLAVQQWYARQPETFFDGPNHPDSKAREYMRGVIIGWIAGERGDQTLALHAVFTGQAGMEGVARGLRLHQLGGTITPKRAKMLTIPITPRAHGMSVANFSQMINKRLFRVKRKDPSKTDFLAYTDDAGALHAAFALKSSVYVPPLKERRGYDALPSRAEIAAMAREILGEWLADNL